MKSMFAGGVALLFILSIAGAAFAEGNMGTFHGRIVDINSNAKVFAVKTFQPVVSPSETGGFRFSTDETTNVAMCNGSGNFRDLKVGAKVEIKYREKADGFVAQTIVQNADGNALMVACH